MRYSAISLQTDSIKIQQDLPASFACDVAHTVEQSWILQVYAYARVILYIMYARKAPYNKYIRSTAYKHPPGWNTTMCVLTAECLALGRARVCGVLYTLPHNWDYNNTIIYIHTRNENPESPGSSVSCLGCRKFPTISVCRCMLTYIYLSA